MNKVVSINLNGNAFQLEEQAFASLSAYLEQAGAKLADNPDQAEIMADIEQAIADKLVRFLSPHKSVVTSEEAETVIAEMGPVDGEAEQPAAKSAQNGPKRLYRITDGEYIGGVANGLAAYFQIDVTLLRILMVLLVILTGGGFVFGYLLCWIFIPPARTPLEQAQAYGDPFNAEEIIARTRAAVEKGHAEGMKQWKAWKRQWREEQRAQKRAYAYHYSYDWHARRSGLGEIVWLIVLIFLAWLGYHHVLWIHQFLDDVWGVVLRIGNGIAQIILAHQQR